MSCAPGHTQPFSHRTCQVPQLANRCLSQCGPSDFDMHGQQSNTDLQNIFCNANSETLSRVLKIQLIRNVCQTRTEQCNYSETMAHSISHT